LIDWGQAGAVMAALGARSQGVARQVRERFPFWPAFQNRAYDLDALPLLIAAGPALAHARRCERYVALLERLCALYQEEPLIRAYFGYRPDEDALIRADPGAGRHVWVCRLDGFIAEGKEEVRLLENNADAPAGTLFTHRVNAVVREVLSGVWPEWEIWTVPQPLDQDSNAFLRLLLDAYHAWGGEADPPRLAILQERGRSNVESQEMARQYEAAGVPAQVADPRQVSFRSGRLYCDGQPVDLCWNKVNTCRWRELAAQTPSLNETWLEVVRARAVCHVNSFAARFAAEDKRSLAIFADPRCAAFFSDEDRDLAAALLPWSRRLPPSGPAGFEGTEQELGEVISERQGELVLKVPFDIRGDGVTIGRSTPRAAWLAQSARATREGGIVQRYVEPSRYPVFCVDLEDGHRDGATPGAMRVSCDTFILGGRFSGFGAKASLAEKVNVFQGGRKVSVIVTTQAAGA
jgi:hypothetical protein